MRTASGDAAQQGIMRTASGGIAPYSPGTFDLDALEDLLDKEDREIGVEKDDLRTKTNDSNSEVERPGRSQRPKTLYWQKKTYGPGNWINRGTCCARAFVLMFCNVYVSHACMRHVHDSCMHLRACDTRMRADASFGRMRADA